MSAAFSAFEAEMMHLQRLDDLNQKRHLPGPGRPREGGLSTNQLHLLTEAIFSRAFRQYEKFIEEAFLLYCQGRASLSGNRVRSFISPKNAKHAKQIIQSGMNFLEWNSPSKIIDRCEMYLDSNNPIKLAITTHRSKLQCIRKVRNAIAHASEEAATQFRSVLRQELLVMPLKIPDVGEFLNMRDRNSPNQDYYLRSYVAILRSVALVSAA